MYYNGTEKKKKMKFRVILKLNTYLLKLNLGQTFTNYIRFELTLFTNFPKLKKKIKDWKKLKWS